MQQKRISNYYEKPVTLDDYHQTVVSLPTEPPGDVGAAGVFGGDGDNFTDDEFCDIIKSS